MKIILKTLMLTILFATIFAASNVNTYAAGNQFPVLIKPFPDLITFSDDVTLIPGNFPDYFTDPDGDPLTYTATSLNSAIATTSYFGSTLAVEGKSIGTTTIRVTAADSKGGKTTASFHVTIKNPPKLTVTNPTSGQKINSSSDPIKIAGTTYTEVPDKSSLKVDIKRPDGTWQYFTISDPVNGVENQFTAEGIDKSFWDQDGTYQIIVNLKAILVGGTRTESKNFKIYIDRTPPEKPTINETPTGTATSKVISLSTPDPTDKIRYKIGLKSDGNLSSDYLDYVGPITLNEDALITAQSEDTFGNKSTAEQNITGISAPEAPIVSVSVGTSTFTVTDKRDYGTGVKVERFYTLYLDEAKTMTAVSGWTEEASFTFVLQAGSKRTNSKYTIEVNARYK